MKLDAKLMFYNKIDLAIEKSKWHHIVYFRAEVWYWRINMGKGYSVESKSNKVKEDAGSTNGESGIQFISKNL